jgi:hypothetical protein
LDHNNPFGPDDPDPDGPIKDMQYCKEHPTDTDCACTIFHPRPEDVCKGVQFTQFNNCGAVGEQLVGVKSLSSPECKGITVGVDYPDSDGDGIPDFADIDN